MLYDPSGLIPSIDGALYNVKLGVLDTLASCVRETAPRFTDVQIEIQSPLYVSVLFSDITDDDGNALEICLGFSSGQSSAFEFDAPIVGGVSGYIHPISSENTFTNVAKLFWNFVMISALTTATMHGA
jgi:hypothetical protein